MSLKFTILGCGSSLGIPRIDGYYGNCDPKNKKNIRSRCSALIRSKNLNILFDTSPDLKSQLIVNNVKNIDKVFTDDLIGGEDGMIPGINKAREQYLNGDFIIDTRLGYQFNSMVKLGFIVNNLLNREYMTRPATMMSPRTFAIDLLSFILL